MAASRTVTVRQCAPISYSKIKDGKANSFWEYLYFWRICSQDYTVYNVQPKSNILLTCMSVNHPDLTQYIARITFCSTNIHKFLKKLSFCGIKSRNGDQLRVYFVEITKKLGSLWNRWLTHSHIFANGGKSFRHRGVKFRGVIDSSN
jgi:hypothetical protein